NPPFTPEIGPILKIEAQNPVSIMNVWKKAIELIANFVENLPYSIVSFSVNKNIIDMQPFIWKKFKVIASYTYLLDLGMSIEDMWNRMSSERRNDITKAEKDGLQIKNVLDYELIKSLVLKTFSKQKLGMSEFYLDKVLFSFAKNSNSFAYATFDGDQPISGSFCIHDHHTAYYMLGGYDDRSKHHGAGALALWESIKHAKKLGLKYFDFEGSMIPQIEKFFRGFGGRLTPYYRISKARLPIEIVLKFFKRELF
ncbi:GNAT family N-acetyltransferase, partial [bacterium]|nr:GNAT family N-acetyltransferase [bacterium]